MRPMYLLVLSNTPLICSSKQVYCQETYPNVFGKNIFTGLLFKIISG